MSALGVYLMDSRRMQNNIQEYDVDAEANCEIPFPFEFIIKQTPVSSQTSNGKSKERWKCVVGKHAKERISELRELYFYDDRPLMATIYYFPPDSMDGDVDNIVKPILDGMKKVIYEDDNYIERVVVQKFEPESTWSLSSPSSILEGVVSMDKPVVYIKIDDDQSWRINQ